MKIAFLTLSIFTLFFSFKKTNAQTEVTPQLLAHLDSLHQDCLDKGENMWNCANDFNKQMDSLLNVAYRKIKSTLTPEKFQILKQEQLKWIRNRDTIYTNANKQNIKDGLGPTDASMAALDTQAAFVKQRILQLLKTYF